MAHLRSFFLKKINTIIIFGPYSSLIPLFFSEMFLKLSTQELDDCVPFIPKRSRVSLDAFQYILQNGVTFDNLYPSSTPIDRQCRQKEGVAFRNISAYHLLEPGNEENLKVAVALIGLVSASIKATRKFFLRIRLIFWPFMHRRRASYQSFSFASWVWFWSRLWVVLDYSEQLGKQMGRGWLWQNGSKSYIRL